MNTRSLAIRPQRSVVLAATLALSASLALAWATVARADDYRSESRYRGGSYGHTVIDGNVVDVQVRVDGATAPMFFRPGTNDRHYFQAFKGRNYSLVVRNTTGRRVGVLISVDGLNVVNGERSRLDRHESMYVLDPWEQTEIKGWRSSLNEVRRFVFVDEERSYAERTGQANGDMGWIRVLAFREVEREPWWGVRRQRVSQEEQWNDSRARELQGAPMAPAPLAKPAPQSDLRAEGKAYGDDGGRSDAAPGTGWGERRYDPVQRTQFEAERYAADQITLRYEYANGLRALGIHPQRPRVWERERGELGFAQPPRW